MPPEIAPPDKTETALLADMRRGGLPRHLESYDARIAWLMAFLANLSYRPFDESLPELKGLFEPMAVYDHKGSQALLLEGAGCMVLAYRGTLFSEFADIKAHVNALKTRCSTGGHVHSGFNGAFGHIAPMIAKDVKRMRKPLLITGHSLGGALATIAAKHFPATACYSFGSPRVGDAEWVAGITVPIFRVVNAIDCVTMLPLNPHMMQNIRSLAGHRLANLFETIGGYRHAGQEIYMTTCPVGQYEGVEMIERIPGFQNLKMLLRCIAARGFVRDHGIVVYRRKLAILARAAKSRHQS